MCGASGRLLESDISRDSLEAVFTIPGLMFDVVEITLEGSRNKVRLFLERDSPVPGSRLVDCGS